MHYVSEYPPEISSLAVISHGLEDDIDILSVLGVEQSFIKREQEVMGQSVGKSFSKKVSKSVQVEPDRIGLMT